MSLESPALLSASVQESSRTAGVPLTIYEHCLPYCAWIGPQFITCTVVDRNLLCTAAHSQPDWIVGASTKVHLNDYRTVDARVIAINRYLDVIWLQTEENICDETPDNTMPSKGRSYFAIGHSGRQLQESPRAVRDGIIVSGKITENGHILGSSGASPGDSGAPIFTKISGLLMGMIVGSEKVPIQSGPVAFVSHLPLAHIVPLNSLRLVPSLQ